MLPTANLKNGLLLYDIQKKKPAINIREGEFYNDIDGYSIKHSSKPRVTTNVLLSGPRALLNLAGIFTLFLSSRE